LDTLEEGLDDVDKLDQNVLNAEKDLAEAQKGGDEEDIAKKQANLDEAKRK